MCSKHVKLPLVALTEVQQKQFLFNSITTYHRLVVLLEELRFTEVLNPWSDISATACVASTKLAGSFALVMSDAGWY